eukprot:4880509-Amphidinium_carterae.1
MEAQTLVSCSSNELEIAREDACQNFWTATLACARTGSRILEIQLRSALEMAGVCGSDFSGQGHTCVGRMQKFSPSSCLCSSRR